MTLLISILAQTSRAAEAELRLQLEVFINGQTTKQISGFTQRDSALFATRHDLRDLGFAGAAQPGPDDELIALADLKDVTYQLDQATQTLHVTAPISALIPKEVSGQQTGPTIPVSRSGFGAVLNYDVNDSLVSGRNSAAGLADGRVYTPWGVLSTQYLGATGSGGSAVRLDSSFIYSDPDSLRRYRAGDLINGGLTWTRPIRIGGIQVDTDFGLRPDLVTFPMAQINGSAAVPSTVDVLINNVHQLSRNVDPGPFAVTQLPQATGAGTVALVVQDALGRQTTENLSFYNAPSLLLPGLASYTGELGFVRRNYGVLSDDYSTPVASATARYGLFRFLTLEGHFEGTEAFRMGGGGVTVNLGDFAILSAAGAHSDGYRHSGELASVGLERVSRFLSLSASIQHATGGFNDVAGISGAATRRELIRAGANLELGRYGSFSVGYTALDERLAPRSQGANPLFSENPIFGPTVGDPSNQTSSSRTKLLSATYTVQVVGHVSGYATAFHDFAGDRSSGVMIGLSIPFGNRGNASAAAGTNDRRITGTEQASWAAVDVGEYGGSILNENGATTRQFATAEYIAPFSRFEIDADRTGHQTALRGSAAGSVVWADGSIFTANTIQDAFAVVDTDGLPNVPILRENRLFGHTDDAGHILVPDLQSYIENHIAIDPTNLPLDADTSTLAHVVRPADRSGAIIKFPLRGGTTATLHLVDEAGHFLPPGSVAHLQPADAGNVVGYDGMVFIRGLDVKNVLQVTRPDGKHCNAPFGFVPKPGEIPDLGQVVCHLGTP